MKTLWDYLSEENQNKILEYAKKHGIKEYGRIEVQEFYDSSMGYYSHNAVGTTAPRQYFKVNGKEYGTRKRLDYIGRRVNMQLSHNFEAGIVK